MTTPAKLARKGKNLFLARLKKKAQEEDEAEKREFYCVDFRRFCISVLCCGLNPLQGIVFMLLNNIRAPSPSTFYRIQRTFIKPLFELAWERIIYWRSRMTTGSNLSLDGAWAHQRNAKQCIVTAIENKMKKLVDFQLVQKAHVGVNSNYSGPSNLMESYGLIRIAERWKDNDKVTSYTHDNDGKCRKILETFTNFEEKIDGGHSLKSVTSKFNKINENNKRILTQFRDSLLRFLKFLQKSEYSYEDRVSYWMNSVNHYKGFHDHCLHDPNYKNKEPFPEGAEAPMFEFLWESAKFLKIDPRNSTQANESVNSLIAKRSRKDTCYGIGWEARAYVSIIIYNDPDQWQKLIWDKLNIDALDPDVQERFDNIQKEKIQQNISRRTDEYRKMEQQRRVDLKNKVEKSVIDPEYSYKERIQKKPKAEENQKPPKLTVLSKRELTQLVSLYHSMIYNKIRDNEIIRVDAILQNILSTVIAKVSSWSQKWNSDSILKEGIPPFVIPNSVNILNNITQYYVDRYSSLSLTCTKNIDDVCQENKELKQLRNDVHLICNNPLLNYNSDQLEKQLIAFSNEKNIPENIEETVCVSDVLFAGRFYDWAIKKLLNHIRMTVRFMMRLISVIPRSCTTRLIENFNNFLNYIVYINSFFHSQIYSKLKFYMLYPKESDRLISTFIEHYKASIFVIHLGKKVKEETDSQIDAQLEMKKSTECAIEDEAIDEESALETDTDSSDNEYDYEILMSE